MVKWKDIPQQSTHGVIKNYIIRATGGLGTTNVTHNVSGTVRSFNVTNLEKYTQYSISVAGENQVGVGVFSSAVNTSTDHDCK